MKEISALLLNQIMCAAENPMKILGKKIDTAQGTTARYYNDVSAPLGVPQLWQIIVGGGVLFAVLVIIIQLIKLLVVNYPKTVTQTKQKVVHAFFVIAVLAGLAGLFDVALTVAQKALGMTYF